MDLIQQLISMWEHQRGLQQHPKISGLNRLAAEAVRHSGPNRWRLFRRAGMPIGASETDDLVSATRDLLVDDIEDGYLPLCMIAGDECPSTHIQLWHIDHGTYEFFVPDDMLPLAAHHIDAINATTDYRVSESGTYATYWGANRLFLVSLSADALMQWASRLSADRSELAERLNVPVDTGAYGCAQNALSSVANRPIKTQVSPRHAYAS